MIKYGYLKFFYFLEPNFPNLTAFFKADGAVCEHFVKDYLEKMTGTTTLCSLAWLGIILSPKTHTFNYSTVLNSAFRIEKLRPVWIYTLLPDIDKMLTQTK